MRFAARLLVALVCVVAGLASMSPAHATTDGEMPPNAAEYARGLRAAQAQLTTAGQRGAAIRDQAVPADLVGAVRRELQLADAQYRYREAVRGGQVVVYALAVDQGMEAQVTEILPATELVPLRQAVGALRALWRSANITDFSRVRLRMNRRYQDSAPVGELLGYYRTSGARYAIDWTYLASINFIESDFGRDNGPSSAGALGPMQFMPGTWQDYGRGGDIMNPKDSITAAAYYLNRMGAPGNMERAIYRYNNDSDYVASVQWFAAAFRADPAWVPRIYYWSTAG